jgi:AcrR family transcriptional regulator
MSSIAAVERPQRQRVDAFRNHERIVAAAREAFVEQGPDVALDAIAHRAGVGNATLYRHFTDRQELIRSVALLSFARITGLAVAASEEEPDAFEALRRFVHQAADEQVGSLCSIFAQGFDRDAADVVEARERMEAAVNRLLARARRSGQLRPDVAIGDLMVAITQLTRPVPGTMCANFGPFMHRHLQLFLDGLHNPPRSSLPGVAATLEDLDDRRS